MISKHNYPYKVGGDYSRTIVLTNIDDSINLSTLLDNIQFGPIEYINLVLKPTPQNVVRLQQENHDPVITKLLKVCYISFLSHDSVVLFANYLKNPENLQKLKSVLNSKYLRWYINDVNSSQDYMKMKTLNYIVDQEATRCIDLKFHFYENISNGTIHDNSLENIHDNIHESAINENGNQMQNQNHSDSDLEAHEKPGENDIKCEPSIENLTLNTKSGRRHVANSQSVDFSDVNNSNSSSIKPQETFDSLNDDSTENGNIHQSTLSNDHKPLQTSSPVLSRSRSLSSSTPDHQILIITKQEYAINDELMSYSTNPENESTPIIFIRNYLVNQCCKYGDIEHFKLSIKKNSGSVLIHYNSIDSAIKTYEYFNRRISLDNNRTENGSPRKSKSKFDIHFDRISFNKDRCDKSSLNLRVSKLSLNSNKNSEISSPANHDETLSLGPELSSPPDSPLLSFASSPVSKHYDQSFGYNSYNNSFCSSFNDSFNNSFSSFGSFNSFPQGPPNYNYPPPPPTSPYHHYHPHMQPHSHSHPHPHPYPHPHPHPHFPPHQHHQRHHTSNGYHNIPQTPRLGGYSNGVHQGMNQGYVANIAAANAAAAVNYQINPDPRNNNNRAIFLGNLHPNTTIEEIANNVRAGGLIESIKHHPDKKVCFITFIDPSVAFKFYLNHQVLHQLVIHGYDITVSWAKNHSGPLSREISLAVTAGASRNVYIGIKPSKDQTGKPVLPTESELRRDFGKFGELEQINFYHNKDCGFLNFLNIADAIKVVEIFEADEISGRLKASRLITDSDKFYDKYCKFKISFAKDRCGNPPKFSFKKVLSNAPGSVYKQYQHQLHASVSRRKGMSRQTEDYDYETRSSQHRSYMEDTINEETAMVFGIISKTDADNSKVEEKDTESFYDKCGTSEEALSLDENETKESYSEFEGNGVVSNASDESFEEKKKHQHERNYSADIDVHSEHVNCEGEDDDEKEEEEEEDDDDDVQIVIESEENQTANMTEDLIDQTARRKEFRKRNRKIYQSKYNSSDSFIPFRNQSHNSAHASSNYVQCPSSHNIYNSSAYASQEQLPYPDYTHQTGHPYRGTFARGYSGYPSVELLPLGGYGNYSGLPSPIPGVYNPAGYFQPVTPYPPSHISSQQFYNQIPSHALNNGFSTSGSQVMAQYLAKSQQENLIYTSSILQYDEKTSEDDNYSDYVDHNSKLGSSTAAGSNVRSKK